MSAAPACANCGAPFHPEMRRFCPECGQETEILPPTLREFAQQFGGAYFSTEGALWRTLKLLLTKPGELTVQYLSGRRKHYVLPLRLYITVSVVLFLLTRSLGGVELVRGLDEAAQRAAPNSPAGTVLLNLPVFSLGLRHGVFECEGLPGPLCRVIQERAVPNGATFLARMRQANQRISNNLGAVMFVLLPLFAACLWLVNARSGLRYAAHLVFALHLHAFWFLVLALMRLSPALLWPGVVLMACYTLMAGRKVYPGRWPARLLRSAALTLMYMSLLGATVAAAWLLALVV